MHKTHLKKFVTGVLAISAVSLLAVSSSFATEAVAPAQPETIDFQLKNVAGTLRISPNKLTKPSQQLAIYFQTDDINLDNLTFTAEHWTGFRLKKLDANSRTYCSPNTWCIYQATIRDESKDTFTAQFEVRTRSSASVVDAIEIELPYADMEVLPEYKLNCKINDGAKQICPEEVSLGDKIEFSFGDGTIAADYRIGVSPYGGSLKQLSSSKAGIVTVLAEKDGMVEIRATIKHSKTKTITDTLQLKISGKKDNINAIPTLN